MKLGTVMMSLAAVYFIAVLLHLMLYNTQVFTVTVIVCVFGFVVWYAETRSEQIRKNNLSVGWIG